MNVLSVARLHKTYPGFALKNVSFDVREGSIMGFIGRNGAGKTTTLKSLLGFVHPDAGDISFFGKPFSGNELSIKQQAGFASGGVDFYPNKKLKAITAVTKRFYPSWDDGAYQNYLKRFELDEEKTPDQLSAGMKVKYSLLLALCRRAKLLILDEPTSGLDPVSRDDLLSVFMDLVDREGISILFSTHITSDLEKCADDITYIKSGEIIASMGMDSFLARYKVVSGTPEQLTDSLTSQLIGCKKERRGFSGLLKSGRPAPQNVNVSDADLESIMVHLERE